MPSRFRAPCSTQRPGAAPRPMSTSRLAVGAQRSSRGRSGRCRARSTRVRSVVGTGARTNGRGAWRTEPASAEAGRLATRTRLRSPRIPSLAPCILPRRSRPYCKTSHCYFSRTARSRHMRRICVRFDPSEAPLRRDCSRPWWVAGVVRSLHVRLLALSVLLKGKS